MNRPRKTPPVKKTPAETAYSETPSTETEARPFGKATKVEIIRHGRDEMNLVEYPFASLWKNTEPGTEILHEWETEHPITRRAVQAFWRVTGDPKLGLPSPSDEQVYLALMELTDDAGLQSPIVHFTRHELLRRLGWPDDQHYYNLLRDAFTRLGAVFITSQNAFWDAKARSFKTIGFNLIDNFEILEERRGRKKKDHGKDQSELPLSFFKWNDVLFESFQAGYIRAIDLDFALSLQSSIALRLFRYLDKKAYDGRHHFEVELALLCERHLGMRPSRYPSKYKERLAPAHKELVERGFLHSVHYEPMSTKKAEKACYAFTSRRTITQSRPAVEPASAAEPATPQPVAPESSTTQPQLGQNTTAPKTKVPAVSVPATAAPEASVELGALKAPDELLQRMLQIKVSPEVARELMESLPRDTLQLQLDCLPDREPKNPAAVFVKAAREAWEPPPKYFERVEATERAEQARQAQEAAQAAKAAEKAAERQREASLEQEAAQLDALWEKLDTKTRERIEQEATERLGILGRMGKAQAALTAMRRNLLRERLAQAATEEE